MQRATPELSHLAIWAPHGPTQCPPGTAVKKPVNRPDETRSEGVLHADMRGLHNTNLWLLVALGAAAYGCDGPGAGRGGASSAGIDTLGGEATTGKADEPGDGDDDDDADDADDGASTGDDGGVDPQKFDVQGGGDDPTPPMEEEEECAVVTESAAATVQPADVIFVIDNSGSMTFEANAVQQNMNGFSQQIVDSGVDVNVVMISSYTGNGVCVAPPLGGGGCPGDDNNLPSYRHIGQSIGSTNALSALLNLHDQWQPSMRAEASKHIVIVTDDNSSMGAAQFDAAFLALDPSYADYKLHGIVSLTNCPQTADIGDVYIDLGDQTDGVLGDLCDQDFQPLFDLLSTEVISGSSLSCQYDIPAPPDGSEFDPTEVNIDFDDGSGPDTIGYVDNAGACAGVVDGWYYDNPFDPTTIFACPQTCERFQDLASATIDIRFGCATVPAG